MKKSSSVSIGIKLFAIACIVIAGYLLIAEQLDPLKNIFIAVDTAEGVSILRGGEELEKIFVSTEDTTYSRPTLDGAVITAIASEECKPNYICKKDRKIISTDINSKKKYQREMAFDISFARFSPEQKYLLVGTNNGWNLHVYENEKEILTLKTISGLNIAIDRTAWISNDKIMIQGSFTNTPSHRGFIATIEVNSGATKIICEGDLLTPFYRGLYKPEWVRDGQTCFEHPEVSALFGDAKWPVEKLLESTDSSGRYYFYRRWNTVGEGYFPITKKWIEGYDRTSGRTFHVYTLQSYWEGFQDTLSR